MSIPERAKGVVKRSSPIQKNNYLAYRPELRADFWYSCAYCSMTEVESRGVGFEIDHYLPREHFPAKANEYQNLNWSCSVCNKMKTDYFPNEKALEKGYVIIRPDEDDPRDHFELQSDHLVHKTVTGEFNEKKLRLNRQALRKLRELRARLYESQKYTAFGISQLLSINLDTLDRENRLIVQHMRTQLGEQYDDLVTSMADFLRAFAKSDLLDEEPNKATEMKVRRDYLKEIHAITVDDVGAKPTKSKKSTRQASTSKRGKSSTSKRGKSSKKK